MKKVILMSIFTALCAIFGCTAKGFVSVDADEFAREIAKSGVQLVDVRTAEEYANGHIPNAVNVDVYQPDFAKQIAKLDKKQTVALYCRSGRRSKSAAEQAVKLGFKVVELDGGILSWQGELER
ncbi:MAG: rhodanese-like domain-containing protein [Alistipes sp.]|nr:rhodanese-like domain-containing protein [Alistipes sp.]